MYRSEPRYVSERNKMTGPHDHHPFPSRGTITIIRTATPSAGKHDGVRVIPGKPARSQCAVDRGHGPQGRDQFRPRRCAEVMGRHRDHPAGRQDRRTSSRPSRKHHLRRQGQGADALGRAVAVHRRSRPGRFHFRSTLCAASEINASRDEVLECVLVRSDGEAVAINLDIEPVEKPETVLWIDPVHRDPNENK